VENRRDPLLRILRFGYCWDLLRNVPSSRGNPAWKAAFLVTATFFGTLWVLAQLEEFFFRGVLQQMFVRETGDEFAGIMITSAIFGLCHLPMQGAFPNWKMTAIATINWIHLGHAYSQAGSVRAPMVTHALVVTTWRVFLG